MRLCNDDPDGIIIRISFEKMSLKGYKNDLKMLRAQLLLSEASFMEQYLYERFYRDIKIIWNS